MKMIEKHYSNLKVANDNTIDHKKCVLVYYNYQMLKNQMIMSKEHIL